MKMLRPRLTPCLLMENGGLLKTVKFRDPKYIGDPLNAVKIFNEKEADEIIVLDIGLSKHCLPPNEKMIAHLAATCRMPLCYGGGVKTIDQIERIIGLGVEKIAIGSAAIELSDLIEQSVSRVGGQSIVGVIDFKRTGVSREPEVVIHNGETTTGKSPKTFALELQARGVGELIVNSVDRDGTMDGYDLDVISDIHNAVNIPLTVLGGAGSLEQIAELYSLFPLIGAAAGSLFVFKGKYRAVLINYPSYEERSPLYT